MKRKIFLFIVFFALLFTLLNRRHHQTEYVGFKPNFIDQGIALIFSPFQNISNAIFDRFRLVWGHYFYLVGLKAENQRLQDEVNLKNLYIISLKEQLGIKKSEEISTSKMDFIGGVPLLAQVIGYNPFAPSQIIRVNKGSAAGVMMDSPVITLEGLVGRVLQVYPYASDVLLLVDPHFAVDVINAETRVRALVVGSGRSINLNRYSLMTHLEFLRLGDEIRTGDLFVTSGLNGLYPRGIPVGNVIQMKTSEDTQSISLLPAVDFSKLEQVLILLGEKK